MPRIYLVGVGLIVLAAAVEDRAYIPFGGERIRLNLWHLLLGPSSFFRKSTAISKARRTIDRAYADPTAVGPTPLMPNEWSREAMLKALAERGQRVLLFSEFSGALAVLGRDYMSGTKETLADLYDAPPHYSRRVGNTEFSVDSPCLSIAAASQTDWFLQKLQQGDVRGGFLARFAFWPAFSKRRFLAIPPEPDEALGRELEAGLRQMRKVTGPVDLGGVQEQYSKWLHRHETELDGVERAGDLSAFWSRLSIMTLKYASLLQLAQDRSLTVTPPS